MQNLPPKIDNTEDDSDCGVKKDKPYKSVLLSGPSVERIRSQQIIL